MRKANKKALKALFLNNTENTHKETHKKECEALNLMFHCKKLGFMASAAFYAAKAKIYAYHHKRMESAQ